MIDDTVLAIPRSSSAIISVQNIMTETDPGAGLQNKLNFGRYLQSGHDDDNNSKLFFARSKLY